MEQVSIIGSGNAGTNIAFYLAEKKVANVMLIDIVEGKAKGKALDLMEAAPIRGYDIVIDGSDDFKDIKGSKVIVISAGMVRKPGMMRLDLLEQNIKAIDPIIEQIKTYAGGAIIIVLTEPVDALTYYVLKRGAFEPNKVLGVAGVLDSARLREFIAEELDVSTTGTTAIILGGHHDYMVVLPRFTRVEGIPITELLSKERIDELIIRTRNAGAEIVSDLKTGSASYGPAAATAEMVEAIVRDAHQIMCCPAYVQGEYGYEDICLGVPVRLGSNGIEKVIELELTLQEKDAFDRSEAVIRNAIKTLEFEPKEEKKVKKRSKK